MHHQNFFFLSALSRPCQTGRNTYVVLSPRQPRNKKRASPQSAAWEVLFFFINNGNTNGCSVNIVPSSARIGSLYAIKEINHRHHDDHIQDSHAGARPEIIYRLIPSGPHDEGIYLMGGKNEGV